MFVTKRFLAIGFSLSALFILGLELPWVFATAQSLTASFVALSLIDLALCYRHKNPLQGRRMVGDRFSNGDTNEVQIWVANQLSLSLQIEVIDEIPIQFQERNFKLQFKLAPNAEKAHSYNLRPTQRGEYHFGKLNIFLSTTLGLIQRRIRHNQAHTVKVYPSYLLMRQYELLAVSHRLTEVGIKRIRRISNQSEFEKIREYVEGDDIRSINWRATARRNSLMVNQYQDEKAQEVYCLLDMGRTMKMPFNGMSLLDYSINASLIISNIAMYKQDRAGLLSFSKEIHSMVAAQRRPGHLNTLLETLYHQQTEHAESDYQRLLVKLNHHIHKRSLMILFTNFESLVTMRRQMPYLRLVAQKHLLLVVFFHNTELNKLLETTPKQLDEIYTKTIAEKFDLEKRQIILELERHGIHAILTAPKQLNVDLINKYLQLKSLGKF
ncbi:MAG: hypothetical protein RIS47_1622 [Bacteroidota bacterium]